ncbi:transporter [Novosphingobium sp. Gsoil 351]|uniref:transporter n=1 Tax=Novosphingobium sp. Gsoil 351 TaxID=2675225 RepID=UPI0012B4FA30|nr:transporter [Novosphingobium sp. Gsoil 351]QGN55180.1 transporter [Novosphingobium sp. Gsoil 351]
MPITRVSSLTLLCATLASVAPVCAHADDRDFCADRPGRGTPACTLAPGQAMVEVGAVDWEHDADAQNIDDTITLGDTLLRIGVGGDTEVQLGITAAVRTRSRDRASGRVAHSTGAGDGLLAIRHGLAGDDGPIAVQALVTLPIGRRPASAGDWGADLLVPFQHDLPGKFQLALTPEIDAAVNASSTGRHLAYGGVVGLSHPLGEKLSLTAEFAGFEDRDPAGSSFDGRVAGSLVWQVDKRTQLDLEADLGVSQSAPQHAVMVGFARRYG